MDEQKYYVKIIQTGLLHKKEYQLYLWRYSDKYSYQTITYDKEKHPDRLYQYQFTKTELSKIMNGAFITLPRYEYMNGRVVLLTS